MTPTIAVLLRKTVLTRLAEITAEAEQLRAALAELGGDDDDDAETRPPLINGSTARPREPKHTSETTISPSSARLDVLRDQHGPVFRITPTVAVQRGQKITGSGKTLEMLEEDNLPGDKGVVVPGNWFAKECEA
jgi:hypothetical protein